MTQSAKSPNTSCLFESNGLRICREDFQFNDEGSTHTASFSLPNGGRAELYLTFEHYKDGPDFTVWTNRPFGKLNEITHVHADEIFGLLSGCNDPDIGIDKFDTMIREAIETDWNAWVDQLTESPKDLEHEDAERWNDHLAAVGNE